MTNDPNRSNGFQGPKGSDPSGFQRTAQRRPSNNRRYAYNGGGPDDPAHFGQGRKRRAHVSFGRPKNGPEERFSLRHLIDKLEAVFTREVLFSSDCVGSEAEEKASSLMPGQILLLENLRFHKAETTGDEAFAGELAKLGDIYVNDAFGTAHRAHASTAVIAAHFAGKKCFGHVMATEIENVGRVLQSDKRPVTAIIGGAKVSSKITIIENLLPKIDHLIVGGGMAYTFCRALGAQTGRSMVEEEHLETARGIVQKAKEQGVQIHLPADSLNARAFANDSETEVTDMNAIGDEWMGLDVGPKTRLLNREVLLSSSVILWNGPVGVFEMSSFPRAHGKWARPLLRRQPKELSA